MVLSGKAVINFSHHIWPPLLTGHFHSVHKHDASIQLSVTFIPHSTPSSPPSASYIIPPWPRDEEMVLFILLLSALKSRISDNQFPHISIPAFTIFLSAQIPSPLVLPSLMFKKNLH